MTEISEEDFNRRLIDKFIELKQQIEFDQMIYGNSFIKLTYRSIEIVEPKRVKIDNKELKNWID